VGTTKKIQERFLYKIWKEQLQNIPIKSQDEKIVEVIDPGAENHDKEGPDFVNARVQIGNIKYQGDIEIDNYHSDWKLHGHNFNKNYNKVILHVIFSRDSNQKFVFSRDGRKIPNITIGDFIKADLKESIQKSILQEREARLRRIPCFEVSNKVEEEYKTAFVKKLGKERFINRCQRMLNRLKELVYLNELNLKEPVVRYDLDKKFVNRKFSYEDFSNPQLWEQLFYESIFEALGYTRNKDIMRKLARSVDLNWLKEFSKNENSLLQLESIFFNISGLIPSSNKFEDEETSVYVRKLIEEWDNLKPNYDGKLLYKTHWHFAKLRPPNFPVIRISGGIRILLKIINEKLVKNIFDKFEKDTDKEHLASFLRDSFIIKSDGFWSHHFVFEKQGKGKIKYFVGLSRADDIIINIVFPIVSIYFEIFGRKNLSEKVFSFYSTYTQKGENHIVTNMINSLSLQSSESYSLMHQGLINLYRNYCSKDQCLTCEIGKEVFN